VADSMRDVEYPQGEWLDEHLSFVVPLRMVELHRWAVRQPTPGGIDWREVLRRRLRRAEAPKTAYGRDTRENTDDIATLATRGDTLTHWTPGTKPGAIAEVLSGLVNGLATAALTQDAGIDFRGHHWCAAGHPGCPRQQPAQEDVA
jgi:hypothetical protein